MLHFEQCFHSDCNITNGTYKGVVVGATQRSGRGQKVGGGRRWRDGGGRRGGDGESGVKVVKGGGRCRGGGRGWG